MRPEGRSPEPANRAQLRLTPLMLWEGPQGDIPVHSFPGRLAGEAGDFFVFDPQREVDGVVQLWLCKKGGGAANAVWVRLA